MTLFYFGFFFLLIHVALGQTDFNETEQALNPVPIRRVGKNAIKDQYIVVFKDMPNMRSQKDSFFRDFGDNQDILRVYEDGLDGFAAKINEEVLNNLRKDPRIEYIEEDQLFTVYGCDATGQAKSWHLSRISARNLGQNGQNYRFGKRSGAGVTAYVIDTGINANHVDFEGRATAAATFVGGEPNVDTNGHGTCVAGVIGGREYGVSKATKLMALKVFGGSGQGSTSGIMAAMNWAIQHHRRNPGQKSIINMSLGGGFSYSLNQMANRCAQEGIPVIVAAGNEGQNACNVSPASAEQVLSVGATDSRDTLASFSNYGRCVNILAPGDQVNCPWIGSNTAIKRGISGTSFSSPCVAGYGAHLLSTGNYSPASLYQRIVSDATNNVVRLTRPETVNRLLYNSCQ